MSLTRTATSVERLMVYDLQGGSYSRIDKRVTQLVSLALLGPLRNLVQNAVHLR